MMSLYSLLTRVLLGAYAIVTGYRYALSSCSWHLWLASSPGLLVSLEATPVSVCVATECWNDFSGGCHEFGGVWIFGCQLPSSCVLGTGFNSKAPILHWFVKYSSSIWGEGCQFMSVDTCGVADDATVPLYPADTCPVLGVTEEYKKFGIYSMLPYSSQYLVRC